MASSQFVITETNFGDSIAKLEDLVPEAVDLLITLNHFFKNAPIPYYPLTAPQCYTLNQLNHLNNWNQLDVSSETLMQNQDIMKELARYTQKIYATNPARQERIKSKFAMIVDALAKLANEQPTEPMIDQIKHILQNQKANLPAATYAKLKTIWHTKLQQYDPNPEVVPTSKPVLAQTFKKPQIDRTQKKAQQQISQIQNTNFFWPTVSVIGLGTAAAAAIYLTRDNKNIVDKTTEIIGALKIQY